MASVFRPVPPAMRSMAWSRAWPPPSALIALSVLSCWARNRRSMRAVEGSSSGTASSPADAPWRSAHYWGHEMSDAVALNAGRRVAEQHLVSRELAEEGAVALAHHDRDEVDGHLVEQPKFQALPGDSAACDSDDAVASEALCVSDCGRYTV